MQSSGGIGTYIHAGNMGAMVEVTCESDFIAQSDVFRTLIHDIAMQIAASDPKSVICLYEQPFIKDSSISISTLVRWKSDELGEKVRIRRFVRFELGSSKVSVANDTGSQSDGEDEANAMAPKNVPPKSGSGAVAAIPDFDHE